MANQTVSPIRRKATPGASARDFTSSLTDRIELEFLLLHAPGADGSPGRAYIQYTGTLDDLVHAGVATSETLLAPARRGVARRDGLGRRISISRIRRKSAIRFGTWTPVDQATSWPGITAAMVADAIHAEERRVKAMLEKDAAESKATIADDDIGGSILDALVLYGVKKVTDRLSPNDRVQFLAHVEGISRLVKKQRPVKPSHLRLVVSNQAELSC